MFRSHFDCSLLWGPREGKGYVALLTPPSLWQKDVAAPHLALKQLAVISARDAGACVGESRTAHFSQKCPQQPDPAKLVKQQPHAFKDLGGGFRKL